MMITVCNNLYELKTGPTSGLIEIPRTNLVLQDLRRVREDCIRDYQENPVDH